MPLSEETVGGTSLPPTVTLTVKEATMRKIKLIVHECFAGKQNPEDVFAAVFLSSAAVLTESRYHGINKRNRTTSGFTLFPERSGTWNK